MYRSRGARLDALARVARDAGSPRTRDHALPPAPRRLSRADAAAARAGRAARRRRRPRARALLARPAPVPRRGSAPSRARCPRCCCSAPWRSAARSRAARWCRRAGSARRRRRRFRRALAQRPNIILVMVDTLRADHLSCYGARQIETPAICSLAADGGTLFDGFSHASWTKPATASLLTSLLPSTHGADREDLGAARGGRAARRGDAAGRLRDGRHRLEHQPGAELRVRPGLRRVPLPGSGLPGRREGILFQADPLPDRAQRLVQAAPGPAGRRFLSGRRDRELRRVRFPRASPRGALLLVPALHGSARSLLRASVHGHGHRSRRESEPEARARRRDAAALHRRGANTSIGTSRSSRRSCASSASTTTR